MTSESPGRRVAVLARAAAPGGPSVLAPALVAGFVVVVLVLVAALALRVVTLWNLSSASDAVTHTQVVKASLQEVLTAAVDAETGERGYIITGEPDYLEPYERARGAIGPAMARLRALTADNHAQQTDLDRLSSVARRKLDELAAAVRVRRETGFDAARAVVTTNIGKHTMDEMRAMVAGMDAREDALLAVRTAQADRAYRVAAVTTVVTSLVAIAAVVGLFGVTWRVASERRRAAQAAERLRVTLASIGDAVIATDEHGRVTDLNPVGEALTGWTQGEALGRRIEEVFVIVNEATGRPAENPVGRVLREGITLGLANHTVLIAKDGREVPVDDSAAPIRTAGGVVAGAVMVFRDVSGRRAAEQERAGLVEAERFARVQAESANRTKDNFLATVSHELRTPLNSILGWAEMLRSGMLEGPRQERALEAVYVNALRQRELIDELLDVSRIISGTLALDRSAVDVASVVRSACDVVHPGAAAKHIDVGVEVDPSMGPLHADGARLQQILVNLLSNAVKFTPDGGTVRVSARQADGAAVLSVADTGQGISPDFLPSVFERFRQAEGPTTRRHGGLGLGLSIVKFLVEAHGGTIAAESRGAGRGATFTVRLPIGAAPADVPDEGGPAQREARSTRLRGVSALVVDDDADTRELLTVTLEHHGAVAVTAASAAQAHEVLRGAPVHVIVSDVGMPDEDGYAFIRSVRSLSSALSTVPAIALTSFARDEDGQRALQAGFDVHLSKPIDPRALVESVATLLRRDQMSAPSR